jgi:hypothetical protein
MSRLLALYPKAWRDRYGDELAAMLEERPASLRDRIDLARGALDAHRHPELASRDAPDAFAITPGDAVLGRRLGFATLAGAVAWTLTWLVASIGPVVQDPAGFSYRDGAAALPLLLLAGSLLVAGLVGQLVILPSSARLARVGAMIAVPSVLLWSIGPWTWQTAAAALFGLALLAIGGWLVRAWSGLASGVLLTTVVALPSLVLTAVFGQAAGIEMTPAMGLFILVPIILWLTVGGTLIAVRVEETPLAS